MWRLETCSMGGIMWSVNWAGGTSPLCGWPGTSSKFYYWTLNVGNVSGYASVWWGHGKILSRALDKRGVLNRSVWSHGHVSATRSCDCDEFHNCFFWSFLREKRFVAMKVVKSAEHYTETALDEIKLLKSVSHAHCSQNHAVAVAFCKTFFIFVLHVSVL